MTVLNLTARLLESRILKLQGEDLANLKKSETLSKLVIPNAIKQFDFKLHNTKQNQNTMQKTYSNIQLYSTKTARTYAHKVHLQIKITENLKDRMRLLNNIY